MTWANQTRILKQNFEQLAAVIGGVFVNAFKPIVKVLNAAMSHIIAFAKTISNALGQIFGWTYEEGGGGLAQDFGSAAESADDLAGSTGKAAKNIDDMKHGIRAFDELNVLTSPGDDDGGGSGGGKGGAGGDLGAANAADGQWKRTETILKRYESEIDTLYKLGETINQTLSNALESINWDEVYEKANGFGTGLASFLNGLISPELFGVLGETVAGALNTALHSLDSFGTTFEWKEFGESIATSINNFFSTFDFKLLSETINTWANGILDAMIEFIEKTEWEKIGSQIGTFLAEIDFLEIGEKIGIAIWEAINAGIDLFKGMFSEAPIETAFLSILALPAIVGFGSKIIGFIVTPFIRVIELLTPLISGIGSLFAEGGVFGAGGIIATASTPVLVLSAAFAVLVAGLGYVFATNEDVRKSFNQAVSSIQDGLQPAIEFISETLLPDLQKGWERLLEILEPLGTFLNDVFVSIWQDMINPTLSYIGETLLPKLIEAFENFWNDTLVPLGNFLADVLEPVIQIVGDTLSWLWKDIIVPLADVIGIALAKSLEGIIDVFNALVDQLKPVIDVFQFLWDKVLAPIVDFLWDVFKPAFDDVFKGIGEMIEGLGKSFGGLIDFIVGVFTGDWEKAWEGVKDIFSGIWESLEALARAPLNGVIAIFEGLANKIVDAWNWIKKQLNNFHLTIPSWVPGAGGKTLGFNFNMSDHINIPRLEKGGLVLQHTFAEIGEYNHKEAVLPLENSKTMSMVADSILDNASYATYANGSSEDFLKQIKRATYEGVMEAITAAGGIKAEATFKVEGDRAGIFKVTQEEARNYYKRTRKPAYT